MEITQASTTGREFQIHLFSPIFAKAVYLHIPETQVSYSDNYFDMLPKAKKIVVATTDRKMNMRKIEEMLVVGSIYNR